MSKVQMVRALVEQRLTAAAEEIFGLFERTIAEYEEELCRSKEENERQQKLLDAVWKPEVRIHRADFQQLLVRKEEVLHKQQEWSPSLDQEDPPEPSHIKEEQEGLWTNQAVEQFEGLDELDTTKLLFTPVLLKSGDDGEKPQSSQLHQRQTEQMDTGADGEDWGGPQPDRNLGPETNLIPKYEDKPKELSVAKSQFSDGGCEETKEFQAALLSLDKCDVPKSDMRFGEKSLSHSECGERFGLNTNLNMKTHSRNKLCSCSVCGQTFSSKGSLTKHMNVHKERPKFCCSICGDSFIQKGNFTSHMAIHTGEKSYNCSGCDQRFSLLTELKSHKHGCPQSSKLHKNQSEENTEGKPRSSISNEQMETGDDGEDCGGPQPALNLDPEKQIPQTNDIDGKRFWCSECGKGFWFLVHLKSHMRSHTGEKPFNCSICGKGFAFKGNMNAHMAVHTDQKAFSCSVCGKMFGFDSSLRAHIKIHLGDKRFSCPFCGKGFISKGHVTQHLRVHTGEKPFSCSVCDQRFVWRHQLGKHKCAQGQRL